MDVVGVVFGFWGSGGDRGGEQPRGQAAGRHGRDEAFRGVEGVGVRGVQVPLEAAAAVQLAAEVALHRCWGLYREARQAAWS